MDWLILLLLVPLILVPIVVLCGFAGCASFASECASDADCPAGTRCEDGDCVGGTLGPEPEVPEVPLRPIGLVATAISTSEIILTWENTDPSEPDSYQVARHEEGEGEEDFAPIPGAPPVTVETFRDQGLQEGDTFFYRVSACSADGCSEPFEGDTAAATTFPLAPSNLVATPIDVNRIDLSWTNNSARPGVEFSLEHRASAADPFTEIFQGPATSFPHTLLPEGSDHEYQVSATVIGLQGGAPVEVRSTPSAPTQARTWAVAFQATLTNEQPNRHGFCLVQRIPGALLSGNPAVPGSGTQVRITVRGPNLATLTLDRIYLSRVNPGGDPYDSLPAGAGGGLTRVLDASLGDAPVTLSAGASQVLGPITFDFSPSEDLLIAIDVSSNPNEGTVRFGTGIGANRIFFRAATQQASVADRAPNAGDLVAFQAGAVGDNLIEKIEVL